MFSNIAARFKDAKIPAAFRANRPAYGEKPKDEPVIAKRRERGGRRSPGFDRPFERPFVLEPEEPEWGMPKSASPVSPSIEAIKHLRPV